MFAVNLSISVMVTLSVFPTVNQSTADFVRYHRNSSGGIKVPPLPQTPPRRPAFRQIRPRLPDATFQARSARLFHPRFRTGVDPRQRAQLDLFFVHIHIQHYDLDRAGFRGRGF